MKKTNLIFFLVVVAIVTIGSVAYILTNKNTNQNTPSVTEDTSFVLESDADIDPAIAVENSNTSVTQVSEFVHVVVSRLREGESVAQFTHPTERSNTYVVDWDNWNQEDRNYFIDRLANSYYLFWEDERKRGYFAFTTGPHGSTFWIVPDGENFWLTFTDPGDCTRSAILDKTLFEYCNFQD